MPRFRPSEANCGQSCKPPGRRAGNMNWPRKISGCSLNRIPAGKRNGGEGSRDKPSSLGIKRTPHLPRTVVNEGCFAVPILKKSPPIEMSRDHLSGMYWITSCTGQERIVHRSFSVAMVMFRFCFKESNVPRLKE